MTAAPAEPHVWVARYAVCSLPPQHPRARYFTVTVDWCGPDQNGADRWAVRHMGECLNAAGVWDFEPSSSSRYGAWLTAHRFDLDAALHLAGQAAPAVTVNGVRAAEVAARGAQ